MKPEPVRVLIADDHTLMREGVRLLLSAQPDFRVVGEAADGYTLIQQSLKCSPDLLLMDVQLPEMNGLEAFHEIHCRQPSVRAVILTMNEDQEILFRALRLGISGYILKGATSNELIEALRVIAHGQVYFSPIIQGLLVQEFRRGWQVPLCDDIPPARLLSPREMEVLLRLAEGQTNAEIAADLVISGSTVQTHRTRILEKLGLKTRADLVKYALRNGLANID